MNESKDSKRRLMTANSRGGKELSRHPYNQRGARIGQNERQGRARDWQSRVEALERWRWTEKMPANEDAYAHSGATNLCHHRRLRRPHRWRWPLNCGRDLHADHDCGGLKTSLSENAQIELRVYPSTIQN